MAMHVSISPSFNTNNILRNQDYDQSTHTQSRNLFLGSNQISPSGHIERMKIIDERMIGAPISKCFDQQPHCTRIGLFGSSEQSGIVSEFNKLIIKVPTKHENEPTSDNSPESDELDVATALLSMSSMQPKLVKLDLIQAPKNFAILRTTNTGSTKPQSSAPLINRMRKSCQCCTKSKLRCIGDGVSPCERCTLQGTMCIYLHQRKRGPAPRHLPKIVEQVSTPSAAKRTNQDLEIASKDPSPSEKKRKASFSEISNFVLGNNVKTP